MGRLTKRLLDLCAASLGLIVLSPLMLAIAGLIRCKMGTPVLFRHIRAGKNGKPFRLLKFRTMTDARDAQANLLPDAQRLTPLGQGLRRLSLDELPQLWNVLGGEMSLVGPRPLLLEYVERYSPEQARRLGVLPGITGWAQTHGRNALTWEQKFTYDVWYVEYWSLWLDLCIVLSTVVAVLKRQGISQPGEATMVEFRGVPSPAKSEE